MQFQIHSRLCRRAGGIRLSALLAACVFLLSLVSSASAVQAQEQPCLPGPPEFLKQQLMSRNYAVSCLPAGYFLFDAQADTWIDIPNQLASEQQGPRALFQSQVTSGQFDGYVIGGQPGWQTTGPLQWVRDFAIVGPRSSSQDGLHSGSQLFALGMWLQMPLDLHSYIAALQAKSTQYERIELESLHLRYLDGEVAPSPQTAYILNGSQMQELFSLDSVFINNRYVIIEPGLTAPTPAGLPVLSFFSGTPITSAEMTPLLNGLLFRQIPLPVEPSLEQVTNLQTPTGLLALLPAVNAAAQQYIDAKTLEIQELALNFAREFPVTNLLPFQLITADTNLYWAPGGWQTGRLLLWEFTGGAHGNLNMGAWTYDAEGNLLSLNDVLVWDAEMTLAAIVQTAIEHRRTQDQLGLTDAQIEEAVRWGLPNLEAVSAWNPIIRNGATGLWITLLPYTIAAYVDGVQEFFVQMPLATTD